MGATAHAEPVLQSRTNRVIGRAGSGAGGPTLVCVAGIHGNEPSGVLALERVFARIAAEKTPLNGTFVGLAGNVRALAASVRYLAKDLNRQWTQERVAAIGSAPAAGTATAEAAFVSEDVEQHELHAALTQVFAAATGRVTVFDLHSASSVTPPFLIFGDTLKNRDFAMRIPTPIVLGLEEQIVGTIMEWVSSLGHVSVAFEAGQHADPAAVDRHEAAIRLALVASGVVEDEARVAGVAARETLEVASRGIPRVLEIVARHAITAEDNFTMKPGFKNFDAVAKGDLLANDRRGEIRATGAARLLFPLYQALGDDGYFLTRPVNPMWLAVSSFLRKSGIADAAPFLPGVARHPRRRDTLVVNRRIARFGARQLFHLFGYRVEASRGGKMIVRKRDREGS